MLRIQRLNMDNSWFFDLDGVRFIVDPWLTGKEVDFFSWFNTQWHRTRPLPPNEVPEHHFVLVTQKYPDHFHKETLRLLNPGKIIVPASVEKKCKRLLPDAEVIIFNEGLVNPFGLPLRIHFLPTRRKIDPIYDALVIENGRQSVFLASHGFSLERQHLDRVRTLPPFALLIAPMNLYQLPAMLGGRVSPGIASVKKLANELKAGKIAATHDEDKFAKGIVSKFAHIVRAPAPDILKSDDLFGDRYLHIPDYLPIEL